MAVVNSYFDKYRTVATGTISIGTAFYFPKFIRLLIQFPCFRTSWSYHSSDSILYGSKIKLMYLELFLIALKVRLSTYRLNLKFNIKPTVEC